MTTFKVLIECLPCLVFVGIGLNFLLTAMVPSWREKGWNHWKYYGDAEGDNSRAWLVQLGFVKLRKPLAEGDFEPQKAIWLYSAIGGLFTLIGLGGIGSYYLRQSSLKAKTSYVLSSCVTKICFVFHG